MAVFSCLPHVNMGEIVFDSIYIPTTNNKRTLSIYLPDGYDASLEYYPVLYMHDGQNLFDDKRAYAGLSWGIKETLDAWIALKKIPKLIVVGIDNSDMRINEYTPFKAAPEYLEMLGQNTGGMGEAYADFCVNMLKPYIDQTYRTKPGYPYTMMAGSSLGALISIYTASKYPNVYHAIGVFSLASWFHEKEFLKCVSNAKLRTDQKYFITIGDHESSDDDEPKFAEIYLNNSRNFKSLLEEKNIRMIYYQETNDIHHESNWRKAFPTFISFVFNQETKST